MDRDREPDAPAGVSQPEPTERITRAQLQAIRRGDADAFEAVARDQAPALFRMARRLTGNREDAEDLVQETLVRSLPRLTHFEGRAMLSTYLMRALGNLWKNRLRSKSRSRVVSWFRRDRDHGGWVEPEVADPTPGAAENLQRAEVAVQLRGALQTLDPVRLWTLLLREVEELSYEQIAEVTRVPVGTVRSRIARARDDLRRAMARSG
jgi:RNA polymerase sigma-70 factor (ECF subfamily)